MIILFLICQIAKNNLKTTSKEKLKQRDSYIIEPLLMVNLLVLNKELMNPCIHSVFCALARMHNYKRQQILVKASGQKVLDEVTVLKCVW